MASDLTAVNDENAFAETGILQPMRSKSLYWQADDVVGSSAISVLPFLFWLIENANPKLLISFDPAPADAYFAFCQAIDRLPLDTQAFNVTAGALDGDMQRRNGDSYALFSTLLSNAAEAAAGRFAKASVDLLYLDLTALPDDLDVWADKLSPRGVVVLHGAADPKLANALKTALKQLNIAKTDFTLVCGKGVALAIRPEAPTGLHLFLQPGMQGHTEFSRAFHLLGKAQQDAFDVQAERAARRTTEIEIDRLKAEQETLTQTIEGLREKLDALDRAYQTRGDQIAALTEEQAETSTQQHNTQCSDTLTAKLRLKEKELAYQQQVAAEETAKLRLKERELAHQQRVAAEEAAKLEQKFSWLRGEVTKSEAAEKKSAEALRAAEDRAEQDKVVMQAEIDDLKAQLGTRTDALRAAEDRAEQDKVVMQAEIDDFKAQLGTRADAFKAAEDRAEQDKVVMQAEIDDLKAQLDTRTDELVALTQLAESRAAAADRALQDSQAQRDILVDLRDAEISRLRNAGGRLHRGDAFTRAGLPSVKSQIETLTASELFDAAWYLETYPDVAESGIPPARHYVLHGAIDGRDPGPDFDTMAYYSANRDVAQRGFNALVHYEMFGRAENRSRERMA